MVVDRQEGNVIDIQRIIEASRKTTSIHHLAAEFKLDDDWVRYLDFLEKKEILAEELNKIIEQKATGYKCVQCKRIFEVPQSFCKELQHNVSRINGIKRFFECRSCHNRVTEFCTLYPGQPCARCGCGDFTRASLWKDFKVPDLRPQMLIRGEETGFSMRNDPLSFNTTDTTEG
jgi:hypothetical protein